MLKKKLDRMGIGWDFLAWVITLLVNLTILGIIIWVAWHFISKYW